MKAIWIILALLLVVALIVKKLVGRVTFYTAHIDRKMNARGRFRQ